MVGSLITVLRLRLCCNWLRLEMLQWDLDLDSDLDSDSSLLE